MARGTPYVHWKIKQDEDLGDIDPTYLWGTIIETNKGPINKPVFIREPEQAKKIFNYNLDPFFANGGRYAVVVRAYSGESKNAHFDITLAEDFKYVDVDYKYYIGGTKGVKAKLTIDDPLLTKPRPIVGNKKSYNFKSYNNANKDIQFAEGVAETTGVVSGDFTEILVISNNLTFDGEAPEFEGQKFFVKTNAAIDGTTATQLYTAPSEDLAIEIFVTIEEKSKEVNVTFFEGRWRICTPNGEIIYWYRDEENDNNPNLLYSNMAIYDKFTKKYYECINNQKGNAIEETKKYITKSFNESDVTKEIGANLKVVPADKSLISIDAIYPGEFEIPISIQKDIRSGYRVSIKDSDDYTLLISGAKSPGKIVRKINERASNIEASLTPEGEAIEKVLTSTLIPATSGTDNLGQPIYLPTPSESTIDQYTEAAVTQKIPVGSIFAKIKDDEVIGDTNIYEIKLTEIVSYLGDGSNGSWDDIEKRILPEDRLQAHQEALDHLAMIKLSGIFCNYGEDDLQNLYIKHVTKTEPAGMNNVEVCRWRTLLLGANSLDRTNDPGEEEGFKLMDKAVSIDDENVLFLGQGLIDDGFEPNDSIRATDEDPYASRFQLLPYQTVQYVAGLRSKLFYGDPMFGGESKKRIRGVGNVSIAPLFTNEDKIYWRPDTYTALNEKGVLTFTEEYGILSLTDGVTTRQLPLEEDEESVQNIIKYAKTRVHETLQGFIGANMIGDLQSSIDLAIGNILTQMQTMDQTLIAIPSEDLLAFESQIVLVPKSNAKQTLAKLYVYLKLTPVHALRQIEVELTIQ